MAYQFTDLNHPLASWQGRTLPKGHVAGRNERCPCSSGKKYKKCHGQAPTVTIMRITREGDYLKDAEPLDVAASAESGV